MPFDSLTFAAATTEIAKCLHGGKVTKIHQPDRFSVVMRVYAEGKNYRLTLSTHPKDGHFALTEGATENPSSPPVFCMLLRKHLEGARINHIKQISWDRVLHIDFDMVDETMEHDKRRLILEIMGKHSNLILIHPETGQIYDGIRRYSLAVSRHREVLPGRTYIAPPSSDKPCIDVVSEEELVTAIANLDYDLTVEKALMATVSGLSPFLTRELVARAGISENTTINSLGSYEYDHLWQAVSELIRIKNQGDFSPNVLSTEGKPYDFTAMPLYHIAKDEQTFFQSMSEALNYYYTNVRQNTLFDSGYRDLERLITTEINRMGKKLSIQQEDLAKAENAEKFKEYGQLLSSYIYLLERGQKEITLPSFEDAELEIKVPLLEELSPQENIKRYFAKYTKAKNAKVEIEKQIAVGTDELEYLESLVFALEEAKDTAALEEIREELIDSGYLRHRKEKKKTGSTPEFLSHRLSDGHTIFIGRNNKENDLLTLKKAGKDDIWLHTQKIPGSHVVIRREKNKSISDKTIMEAAAIAAWHSKAKNSEGVPVDYTEISQVKKPKGAKAGMVIYFQQRTVYVTPKPPK